MPASDDDWRLTNQESYLMGANWSRKPYRRYSERWEHDHCSFCWVKLMEPGAGGCRGSRRSPGGDIDEGYSTKNDYYWVCPTCFEDFKERFKWTVSAP